MDRSLSVFDAYSPCDIVVFLGIFDSLLDPKAMWSKLYRSGANGLSLGFRMLMGVCQQPQRIIYK
ncbi:hypothetical protein NC653_033201 [Populus alba x Populus x berolinensis]|uniref:Uncharacterized protein n=1 Tax=Populus alba x Populus x berolinensis TaxID=444605 RepID=A0AAD6LT33_9ROSI|nr:hypothetical protein NC653_033201 [Populus alba x Populus x berolinensis]